jgi:hypothetical protein
MQIGLREEIDGDLGEHFVSVSDYRTDQNRFEIRCGLCSSPFFANKVTHDNIVRVIDRGLENPFVCDDCQQELDAESHESR